MKPQSDPNDAFFRADARRLGISTAEYEVRFGVQLTDGPAAQRADHHEVTAGLVGDSDFALAQRFERKRRAHHSRSGRRDRARPIRKAGRFATRAA